MDTILFRWINGWPHPVWAESLVQWIEKVSWEPFRFGVVLGIFMLGLLLKKSILWKGALCLTIAMILSGLTVLYLKPALHRARPKVVLQNVHTTVQTGSYESFPAGIALRYSIIAFFMILMSKRGRVFWILLTFLTSLSRVYGGAHWPSDILGAWVISFFFAWISYKAYLFLEKNYA